MPYTYTDTMDMKLVADYARLSINEVIELDCYTYRCLVRDAFIHLMAQSEEGRKYLEDAYLLKQTAPDRQRLRQEIGANND